MFAEANPTRAAVPTPAPGQRCSARRPPHHRPRADIQSDDRTVVAGSIDAPITHRHGQRKAYPGQFEVPDLPSGDLGRHGFQYRRLGLVAGATRQSSHQRAGQAKPRHEATPTPFPPAEHSQLPTTTRPPTARTFPSPPSRRGGLKKPNLKELQTHVPIEMRFPGPGT